MPSTTTLNVGFGLNTSTLNSNYATSTKDFIEAIKQYKELMEKQKENTYFQAPLVKRPNPDDGDDWI